MKSVTWKLYVGILFATTFSYMTMEAEILKEQSSISEQQYDSLAAKFYESEMVCTYDSVASQQIKSMSTRTIENFIQNHEYIIYQDANHETYIKRILIILIIILKNLVK